MIINTAKFYNNSELIIEVNLETITSSSNTQMLQSNISKLSWGILSNEGKLTFIDKDGTILPIIKSVGDFSQLICKIYIENVLYNRTEQIAEKYVSNLTYDKDNMSVSVLLKDDLEEWQKINIAGFNYKTASSKSMTAKDMYEYLWSCTPSKFNMCPFEYLSNELKSLLSNTEIKYPMINAGTLWQSWDKFAKSLGLYIYKQMHKITANEEAKSTVLTSLDYTIYGVQ